MVDKVVAMVLVVLEEEVEVVKEENGEGVVVRDVLEGKEEMLD